VSPVLATPVKQVAAGVLDVDVGYVDVGPPDGPGVVLLHGWPHDIHTYAEVWPPLAAAGYRVIVPFTEPSGPPAWKSLPSCAVLATGDKVAGTDVVRSMAERAGATITEVEGSHVIMISRPDVVADVIKTAAAEAAGRRSRG